MKQTIAIDVDDVILPHFGGLISWYNQKYGTSLTFDHNHPTDITPWGVNSIDEAVRRVHGYYDSDEFRNELPYEEAVSAIVKLRRSYELVVITGRDHIVERITLDWLHTYFPSVFRSIHFTAQYSLSGKSRSKVEVMKEEGASYFIDDFLPAILSAAEAGFQCILFGDYPWNRTEDELPENVSRCNNWREVLEYFDGRY